MANSAKEYIKDMLDKEESLDPFQESLSKLILTNEKFSEEEIIQALQYFLRTNKIEQVTVDKKFAFGSIMWSFYPKLKNFKYYYLDNGGNPICKEVVVATDKDPGLIKHMITVIKQKITTEYGIPASEMENLPLNEPSDFSIDRDQFMSYKFKVKY